MDSRLLNVFHDDPFDGNYVKYENGANFWSSGSETMDLQLAETLHGILPIAPTEDSTDIYNNTSLKEDLNFETNEAISTLTSKNVLLYEGLSEQHLVDRDAIEIITVDPNLDDFETDSDVDGNDYDEFEEESDEIDKHSQHSNATFRSRTDSSSIGDYESHTSDYDDEDDSDDDDDDENELNLNNCVKWDEVQRNTLAEVPNLTTDDLILDNHFKSPLESVVCSKNRTYSTNTIGSDVDALGLQIDASTFDLADFITKDDFALNASSIINVAAPKPRDEPNVNSHQKQPLPASPIVIYSNPKADDSDSDSDVIVDVETLEFDDEEAKSMLGPQSFKAVTEVDDEDVPYMDKVKKDPTWSPNEKRKPESCTKQVKAQKTTSAHLQENNGRNFAVVPNKKQCKMLKGKFGCGRGKLTTKTRNKKLPLKKLSESKETPAKSPVKPCGDPRIRRLGIGQGGKNLAIIQQNLQCSSDQSSEDSPVSAGKCSSTKAIPPAAPAAAVQAVKRKLNLEEYKKRRSDINSPDPCKMPRLSSSSTELKQTSYKVKNQTLPTPPPIVPIKHSEIVTSVVKSLKEPYYKTPATDPITEAKNKVLRMNELKKARQIKILDSAVSAKVPRVTKMLPLKEIVRGTYCAEGVAPDDEPDKQSAHKAHSDYEEIIIVSTSCNTDISIPPAGKLNSASMNNGNNASRSLLKSSALMHNISDSFEKVQGAEFVRISNNSLLVSIQDVVVKNSMPVLNQRSSAGTSKNVAEVAKEAEQHGEDKVIMHLRKDRIRMRTCSIGIQTDLRPDFAMLQLPKHAITHKSRERTRPKSRRNYRHRHSSSSASSHDSYTNSSNRSRSRSAALDNYPSSTECMRQCDTAASYSSRSSRRHRSSLSSSYSESDRFAQHRRQRKPSHKQRAKDRDAQYSSYSSASESDRSRSRSRSRSRNRTRSRSPFNRRSRSRSSSPYSHSRYGYGNKPNYTDRNVSQPAVEERRIVYVGRIEEETTKEMLRRKFLSYGNIKQITIHYKENGLKYGFVTYERSQDAFTVIDGSARDPHINMYDISFGGRRAFCRASYADLDNAGINTYQSYVFPKAAAPPKKEDSFEALLLQVKAKLDANKSSNGANTDKI